MPESNGDLQPLSSQDTFPASFATNTPELAALLPQKPSIPEFKNDSTLVQEDADSVVSLAALQERLQQQHLTLVGERMPLSRGFNGPLYELQTAEHVPVVEVCFAVGGNAENIKRGKSYLLLNKDHPSFEQARPRLRVINPKTSEVEKVAVDWVYNEEQALKQLQGIPGIPHFYGAVREQMKGSILMEKIEGYDLFEIGNHEGAKEINEVFDKIIDTYCQAAERGYVYNNPAGATIMVDAEARQPYLTDWYNYHYGSINNDATLRETFSQGITALNQLRGLYLSEYYEKEFQEV